MSNRIPLPITEPELAYLRTLTFDLETGRVFNSRGWEIGSLNQGGRFQIQLAGRNRRRHHIIWWAGTGEWPTSEIDHKNRNRTDDRFVNLELSTPGKNNQNVPKRIHHDLPVGVVRYKRAKGFAYIAQIQVKGKHVWLGSYKTPVEASEAYQKAWCISHPDE